MLPLRRQPSRRQFRTFRTSSAKQVHFHTLTIHRLHRFNLRNLWILVFRSKMRKTFLVVLCGLALMFVSAVGAGAQVPLSILMRITQAEDERRWDGELRALLAHRDASVRKRAALAAGRIG